VCFNELPLSIRSDPRYFLKPSQQDNSGPLHKPLRSVTCGDPPIELSLNDFGHFRYAHWTKHEPL